jgi:protein phosphatase
MNGGLRIASATDIGRNPHRDMNEDSVLVDDLPLVAVADGMGGHEAGEVASGLAIETLKAWKDRLAGAEDDRAQVLRDAFAEINRTVLERGESDPSTAGMGTTLTAGWIDGDGITVGHVGDSRLYLLRGTNFRQLTVDQTVAQELVRRGRIREDELESSPQRNYLLQAIGVAADDELDVAITTEKLRPGDRLLFATDGLYGMLQDSDQIKQILLDHPDAQEACDALVDAANEAGGHDNISVVIVEVPGDASSATDDEVLGDESGSGPAVSTAPPAPSLSPVAPAARRSNVRRWFVLAGAAVLLAAMAVVFVLRPATETLVVASRRQNVVILEGRPGRTLTEPAQGKIVHTFPDAKVDEFPTTVQRDLRSGIKVDSLAEANQVVDQLPRVRGPGETPSPEPTEPASPSPKTTPSPKP